MADQDRKVSEQEPRFAITLPGGRVAKVPLSVLEAHVDPGARAHHGATRLAPAKPQTTTLHAGESAVTINIFTSAAAADRPGSEDVVAHSLSVDATTGTSEWHTDWEYGECEYTDESGFPQRIQGWHRHPFGTEYTELYEG
jgi:hypothetical protein